MKRKYSSVCDECGKCAFYKKQKCLGLLTYDKMDCYNPRAVKQRKNKELELTPYKHDDYYKSF